MNRVIGIKEFNQIAKNKKLLVYGTAGYGRTAIVQEFTESTGKPLPINLEIQGIPFFDEINTATPETLNTLYKFTHKPTHLMERRKKTPYKYGKHAYKKEVK